MATHSSILAWKVGYSPWGHKESDTTERLHFHFFTLDTFGRPLHDGVKFLAFPPFSSPVVSLPGGDPSVYRAQTSHREEARSCEVFLCWGCSGVSASDLLIDLEIHSFSSHPSLPKVLA